MTPSRRPTAVSDPKPALAVLAAGAAVVAVTAALTGRRESPPWSADAIAGRRWRGGRPRRQPRGASHALDLFSATNASLAFGTVAAGAMGWRYGAAALPVLVSGAGAHALQRALRLVVRRPRPLVARLSGKRTPSFPSGHAARAAAILGVLGHAGVRERLAPGAVVYPAVAVASLGAGLARVSRGRHWPTDVLAGLGLGAAVAAACSLWYDAIRDGER